MKLLVVIVNYRTAGLAVDCLRSLEGERRAIAAMRATVVDCNSAGGSSGDASLATLDAAIARHGWRGWVTLMALNRNAGFAGGNNAAIRYALESHDPPEYVMLLNPDTLVRPGAVRELVAFLDAKPEAGLAGSRLEDADGNVQVSAFRFPSFLSEVESALRLRVASRMLSRWQVAPAPPETPAEADWLSGASLLIRRSVLDEAGLLDEGYFMYYEDVDFCRAARAAGWSCWYVPSSHVVHLVSQASRIESAAKPRPPYWFEARRRYFVKNHGAFYAAMCDAGWIAGFSLWRARVRLLRRPDPDPPRLLRDFIRFSVLTHGRKIEAAPEPPAPAADVELGQLPPNVVPFGGQRRSP